MGGEQAHSFNNLGPSEAKLAPNIWRIILNFDYLDVMQGAPGVPGHH